MWLYEGRPFTDEQIGDNKAFVYEIKNLITGRLYIGKKLFTKSKIRQVNKKKKKTRVSSDWQDYYGSNAQLQADVETHGKHNFWRVILHLCKTKGEASYREAKLQFDRDVLLDDNYYNQWIQVKVTSVHVKGLK